ncbi:MAG: type I-E CRISPR-associated endoribonuclease Cas2 [Succinivibrionaceae bacterium]|nr:type I-E CRISPR-associated endoribonuclease Cas2 [Succinivibrionaceae bacterium]
MIVVIANEIPDAIKGKMKLYFIELKPNVFVSGVSDYLGTKLVEFLFSKSPSYSDMTILKSINKSPGYEIINLGFPKRECVQLSGLQLIKGKIDI